MGNSRHPGSSAHGGWLPSASEGIMILVMVMAGGDFPVHTESQSTAPVAPEIAGCIMQVGPTLGDAIASNILRGLM